MAEIIEYPLNVLYRIDNINYRIEYINNYSLEKTTKKSSTESPSTTLSLKENYLIFIQNKNIGRLNILFYNIADGSLLKKQKLTSYEGFFKLLEDLNGNNYIFMKNVRREMYYLKEHYPLYHTRFSQLKIYCIDTYLKYQLCLPLYVQGKASKRFRIPNIDEYLEKKQIKPFSPQKSEFSRMRQFISFLVCNLVGVVEVFHKLQRGNSINKNDVSLFIEYMIISGFEKNHIVIITTSKKRFEKPDGIDCLSLEQYFKYITNYKKDYQVLIIDGYPDTFKNIPNVYFLQ